MAWWSIANTLTAPFRSALNVALDRLSNNYAQTSLPDDATVRPGMLVYLNNTNQLSLRNADDDDYLNVRLIFVSDDEPTIIHPFMLWHDTTNDLLKQVRADGTTWETIASWDGINFLPYRSGYVITELATAPVTLDATAEPTVDDDSELDTNPDGPPMHTVLSIWKNASLTAGKIWWLCRDNSIGAAVWDFLFPVATQDEKDKRRVVMADGTFGQGNWQYIGDVDSSTGLYQDNPLDDEQLKLEDAKNIRLVFERVLHPVGNNRNLRLQFFTGVGVLHSSSGDYSTSFVAQGGGLGGSSSIATIQLCLDYLSGGTDPKGGMNGWFEILNGSDVAFNWLLGYRTSAYEARQEQGTGFVLGFTGPITGVKVLAYNAGTYETTGFAAVTGARIMVFGLFDDYA